MKKRACLAGLTCCLFGSALTAVEARQVVRSNEQSIATAPQAPPAAATVSTVEPNRTFPGAKLSTWAAEVAKLAEAGLDELVLQTFIDSAGTFNLSSDQIIYLRDIGLSPDTISSMLRHDVELGTGIRQMSPSAVPPSAPALQIQTVTNTAPADALATTKGLETAASLQGAFQSIINEVPEATGPGIAVPVSAEPEWFWPASGIDVAMPSNGGLSAVRQPYPVGLTDPIVVFRGSPRPPNIMVLAPFP